MKGAAGTRLSCRCHASRAASSTTNVTDTPMPTSLLEPDGHMPVCPCRQHLPIVLIASNGAGRMPECLFIFCMSLIISATAIPTASFLHSHDSPVALGGVSTLHWAFSIIMLGTKSSYSAHCLVEGNFFNLHFLAVRTWPGINLRLPPCPGRLEMT